MQIVRTLARRIVRSIYLTLSLWLLFVPISSFANPEYLVAEPRLNLALPDNYTTPPPDGIQHNLNITANIHQGALSGLKLSKARKLPLGLIRVKVDKTMKVRGWEVKDNFYIGQTRVGKDWGLGMVMTRGNFAYGLNNKGVGMTYKSENSRYRLNMQEISMKIDF